MKPWSAGRGGGHGKQEKKVKGRRVRETATLEGEEEIETR